MIDINNKKFILHSEFEPAGDQIQAIKELTLGCQEKKRNQVLLGVTGSGKTFTMANVIQNMQKPTIIMAHNKTLAAQLYEEMKNFFPENSVEYFVSYYDYYQPEAYIAKSDKFIEKDSAINEQIDLMRHSATRALIERNDVIIIASVSCIYGLGSPELYAGSIVKIQNGMTFSRDDLVEKLIEIQYKRNDVKKERGCFAVKGDTIEIFPAHLDGTSWKISMFGDEIEEITECDSLTGIVNQELEQCVIYANTHFMTSKAAVEQMVKNIKAELVERVKYFDESNRYVEAQRIEQRTNFDMEMILETGSCKGIENYSRFLTGRKVGEAPPTLFEYLPKDALLIVDESHVSLPQIRGMLNGDRARKNNLVGHGFRLPSALDNRPLGFHEWDEMRPNTIMVSATPGVIELEKTNGEFVQQIIRPTGLLDPECIVKPLKNQVDDLMHECRIREKLDERVLCTTLTKKSAEELCTYLIESGIKAVYLHSDVKTLERIEIIQELRHGTYDVLIGVNLLREGLDIPECSLVAILDADKEGFLRSETSLTQTIGRAARNVNGKVILYADKMTKSITKALATTAERMEIQKAHNAKHNITPTSVRKKLSNNIMEVRDNLNGDDNTPAYMYFNEKELRKAIKKIEKEMFKLASDFQYEDAARLKDQRDSMKKRLLLQ